METQADDCLDLFVGCGENHGIGALLTAAVIVAIRPAIGPLGQYRFIADDLFQTGHEIVRQSPSILRHGVSQGIRTR